LRFCESLPQARGADCHDDFGIDIWDVYENLSNEPVHEDPFAG